MKNDKRVLLADVNQYITCVLCKGYLIDATTITECLHTFCKTCIVQYLEENTNCPICDTVLHQSHPLLYISHDRTLQTIVYKIVGDLEKSELERQVKYFKESKQEFPAQLRERLEQNLLFAGMLPSGDPTSSESAARNEKSRLLTASTEAANGHNQNFHRDDEQISISLEPLEGLDALQSKFILCSCHSTITHLKKYVALKIFSDLDQYKELEILCDDEILGKDHTLKFILVTKWKDKEMPLCLNFRPKWVF